jgi:hypothetical protein
MPHALQAQAAEEFADDVPQCVKIPPPQADLMLEDRAHMLTVSPPGDSARRITQMAAVTS